MAGRWSTSSIPRLATRRVPLVDVRYSLTARDIVFAVAAANRHSRLSAAFAAGGVVLTATSWHSGDPTWPVPLIIAAGFASGLMPGVIAAWGWRRRPELAAAMHVVVSSDGVALSAPISTTTAWSEVRRVRESGGSFLIDFGTGTGTLVPRRVLGDLQASALREVAESAGVLAAASSWRWTSIGIVVGIVLLGVAGMLAAGGYLMLGAPTA